MFGNLMHESVAEFSSGAPSHPHNIFHDHNNCENLNPVDVPPNLPHRIVQKTYSVCGCRLYRLVYCRGPQRHLPMSPNCCGLGPQVLVLATMHQS